MILNVPLLRLNCWNSGGRSAYRFTTKLRLSETNERRNLSRIVLRERRKDFVIGGLRPNFGPCRHNLSDLTTVVKQADYFMCRTART